MSVQRDWATPIAAGAFLLSAVTGALLFFHLDRGLNKTVHEWLSWVFIAGVALHAVANFNGFKRHLKSRRGRALIGVFVVILALSFVGLQGQGKDGPPFAPPLRALAETPLATLAQVARLSPEQLNRRLTDAGLRPVSDHQTLADVTGSDLRAQVHALAIVFRK